MQDYSTESLGLPLSWFPNQPAVDVFMQDARQQRLVRLPFTGAQGQTSN